MCVCVCVCVCLCVCVCGAAKPSKQITLARPAIVRDAKKTKSSVQLLMEGWGYLDISGKICKPCIH